MATFLITQHHVVPGRAAIEIIGEDGHLLATLYASDDQHLLLVSKHLDGIVVDSSEPPVANIRLKKT